jgi:hypothetical protein
MVEGKGVYGILVAIPETRRQFERPRRRWEGNINMEL